MGRMDKIKHRTQTALDWFYDIGIAIKGFDGTVELIAGILLWVAPGLLHGTLQTLLGEARESNSRMMQFVADNIGRIDADLAKSGLVIVIFFLIMHGVVKVGLVICLFKKWHWAYPWAIAVLSAFLVYQVYVFVKHPTFPMALFSVLDAVIVWLVYKEYREVAPKKPQPTVTTD